MLQITVSFLSRFSPASFYTPSAFLFLFHCSPSLFFGHGVSQNLIISPPIFNRTFPPWYSCHMITLTFFICFLVPSFFQYQKVPRPPSICLVGPNPILPFPVPPASPTGQRSRPRRTPPTGTVTTQSSKTPGHRPVGRRPDPRIDGRVFRRHPPLENRQLIWFPNPP